MLRRSNTVPRVFLITLPLTDRFRSHENVDLRRARQPQG
jgi:hypothetical protein